ncbi:unnamed protein product, partial [Adineta steineri]
ENNDNKSITESDVLVTGFHHAAFDRSSRQIFFNDLVLAYTNNVTYLEDEECLEYIDYTVHERLIDMTLSREFWHSELEGYNIEHPLLLPFDRQRSSTDHRSGLASLVEISFDKEVSKSFLNYASSSELTPFQLGLAIFYTFLFKLTHGQTDLCITSINANRYRHELQNMIGMFVSTLPYRLQLNSHWSFDELAGNVREKCLSILEHSHYPLQHILGSASNAQARIWLDEQTRFDRHKSKVTIYNMPFIYQLCSSDVLSTVLLHQALLKLINKHQSLRTLLIFNTQNNMLMQRILDSNDYYNNKLFTFIQSTYETHEQLNNIIYNEQTNSQYFDLTQGLVFRCHLIYHKQISSNDLLCHKDVIIFNFHHALFDFPSMDIFLNDLNQAYTTGQLSHNDESALTYLDYTVIEQEMPMTGASMFWLDALHDCNLDQSLPLPFDRHRLLNEQTTNRGISISFDFDKDLSYRFLYFASSMNIPIEHLAFAIYYTFVFKLTNGETNLCVAMNANTRYRDELKTMIGLFENIVPLRCQLDSHQSFHQLVEYVHEIITSSMKYSYFPLQRILNQHPNMSKAAFLDTFFEFHSNHNKYYQNEITMDNAHLHPISYSKQTNTNEVVTKCDFSLDIQHDSNINQFSCIIKGSLDVFDKKTIQIITQRFHFMLEQLFTSDIDHLNKSVYELSLMLPNERLLIQSLNNTQMAGLSSTCIHHEFVYQVMKHPQKLAIELDEQSLTYGELLYYVQILSRHLVNNNHVVVGEVICQCVQRSLSMIIGIMAIEMVGGIYCPLSPRDPSHRLHSLVQQTQSRLVLVHWLTRGNLNDDIITVNMDSMLIDHNLDIDDNVKLLSSVDIEEDNIAYIIFTSGSTGMPKAVQIRHRSFLGCIQSLVDIDLFTCKDNMIQMASCSYDVHVQEIMGALIVGSTLVMLHSQGNMDLEYVLTVLDEKQISYMQSVPTYINHMFDVSLQNDRSKFKALRTIDIGGDVSTVQLIEKIYSYLSQKIRLWNIYGPAEATIQCTSYPVDATIDKISIPIGHPLSNYMCMIMDGFSQSVTIDQEGELCVGGVGVFAGYLGRDDLTAKALVEIDGELFYRTGDLARIDSNGLLHYQGRKDHQIKLHGQRIELGEIERCLLSITSISACVVIKWNDNHLVAYVQSSDINEQELRQHCQSHLPPHMIPSFFIILNKLPLNPNGKIDRKQLPSPHFSSIHPTNSIELLLPTSDIEIAIHRIWCEIFKQNQISTDTNIFTIGGHSLLMMQLLHQYKIEFHLEQKQSSFSISNLFQHPTIIHHAQLIQQSLNISHTLSDYPWSSLNLIQGKQNNLY